MYVLSTRQPMNYFISQKKRSVSIECDGIIRNYEIPSSSKPSEIFGGEYKATFKTWDQSRLPEVSGCKFIFFSEFGAIENSGGRINVKPGTLAIIQEEKILSGSGICISIDGFSAPFAIIESPLTTGALNYINGCSTTPLWGPQKKGFPCAHTLYMPEGTNQANHWHPTVRFGVIHRGDGHFSFGNRKELFSEGTVLVLDPGDEHSFHTLDSSAVFFAFHPDSTLGPTDEEHPMLDRTYVNSSHGKKIRNLT